MDDQSHAQTMLYKDVWLMGGARTPFADFNGTLRDVSATDLGIKAAREALQATKTAPDRIDAVVAASVAQTSFDAFFLARHIGLYAGVPIGVPALVVQRLCTSGFEAILQAADQLTLGKSDAVLCVGTESMSRNPIASYSHRGGFRMGQVEFKDFLWEATLDTAPKSRMGDTAEELAKRYQITREDTDAFAATSFERAMKAREAGYFKGEVVPVVAEQFEREGYQTREIRLPRGVKAMDADDHPRPTPLEALKALKPAFKGVQTGGNSSAIVDGAAAVVVANGKGNGGKPLARIVAGATVGVPPEIMGIGPAPAIRAVLAKAGLEAGGHRALRDQRGVRRAVHRRGARAGAGSGQGQRQRRGHRHRPPAGRDRRALHAHGGARTAALRRPLRHRHRLRRRRPGRRDFGGELRCCDAA